MEDILSDKNILCVIFKHLNLSDLLKAAKVCRIFRTVIIDSIWKNAYKQVEACKTKDCYLMSNEVVVKLDKNPLYPADNLVTTLHPVEKRTILNAADFWEFLHLNRNNIQTLSLQTEASFKDLPFEELNCEQFFCNFHHRILTTLKNLTKFTLISTNSFYLTTDFFETLTSSCPRLQYLCLQYCNVKEFTPVATLNELELRYCNGFTWNDFQNILSQTSLQSFTSYATRYTGNFEYFVIASNFEHIGLHYNIVNNIKTLFCGNQKRLRNLRSLDWSVDYAKHCWLNATNCPQLETLTVKPRNLQFDNLLEFTFLKSLILDVNNDLTDSDIVQILKHSNLNSFTLNTTSYNWLIDTYEYRGSYETEWANLKTNLSHINLCCHKTLSPLLHNWFNLLRKNRTLSLKLKFRNLTDSLTLEDVLGNPRFPTHLKSINIFGCIIDCSELRNNYYTVIQKMTIKVQENTLKENYPYIIL